MAVVVFTPWRCKLPSCSRHNLYAAVGCMTDHGEECERDGFPLATAAERRAAVAECRAHGRAKEIPGGLGSRTAPGGVERIPR